jgi:hypothetical protein
LTLGSGSVEKPWIAKGKGQMIGIEQNLNDTNTTCIIILLAVQSREGYQKGGREKETMIERN